LLRQLHRIRGLPSNGDSSCSYTEPYFIEKSPSSNFQPKVGLGSRGSISFHSLSLSPELIVSKYGQFLVKLRHLFLLKSVWIFSQTASVILQHQLLWQGFGFGDVRELQTVRWNVVCRTSLQCGSLYCPTWNCLGRSRAQHFARSTSTRRGT